MPRLFTLDQAQKLLPGVESALREAIALKSEYQAAEVERQEFSRRIGLLGGVVVDHSGLTEQKRRRESAAQQLRAVLEKIQEFGCLVKDLDIGLVDFPTSYNGVEVYLCWKLGESGIHYWHGIDEGFRGRKPIDQQFLEQHKGELPS